MPDIVCDLIGKDLAGYQLVNAKLLELDHQLMGCFPAIFSGSREPVIFVEGPVLSAAKARLERRRSKTQEILFLLNPDGASGFVLRGDKPCAHKRCRVYTRKDHDAGLAIEWAPGLF